MATKYIDSITFGDNEYKFVDDSSGYTDNTGTVTGVTAGAGLNTTSADTSTDGGTINNSGTLYLTKTAVTPGTYQGITVDKYGRVTGASNQGYTTNTGTVTSVGVSNPTGETDLTITGSPVTSSGTIKITHSNSVTGQDTQGLYPITFDAHGHITSCGSEITQDDIINTVLFPVPIGLDNSDNYVSNVTFAEIQDAVAAGMLPYLIDDTGHVVQEYTVYAPLVGYYDLNGDRYFTFKSVPPAGYPAESTINGVVEYEVDEYDDVYVHTFTAAASSHTHGNITNGGGLQTTDVTPTTGDKLVITDASNSNKIARSSLEFSQLATGKFLSENGSWSTPNYPVNDVKVDDTSVVSMRGGIANLYTSTTNPYNGTTNPLATMDDIAAAGGGTVTSVGISGTSPISASGTITSSGTLSVSHENSGVVAQNTQALYPFKVNATGHITEVGTAVTVPTVTTAYNPNNTTNAMSGKAVSAALQTLDSSVSATTGEAISAITITNGLISSSSKISVGDANQDAFSNVKVGNDTITADNATDTLELVAGTGISLTADTTNDKVTIANSGVTDVTLEGASVVNNGVAQLWTPEADEINVIVPWGSNTNVEEAVEYLYNAIPSAGSTATAVGTTASGGSATTWSKSDHVHNITGTTITSALGYTPYDSTNPSGYTSNTGTVTSVGITAGDNISVSGSPITTSGDITVGVKGNTTYYGTCSTAAATVAKTTTITDFPTTLTEGMRVSIKFTNSNTASTPTLSINSGTAHGIRRYGTTTAGTSAGTSWQAGTVLTMTFDGSYWFIDNWLNSTYSEISQANIESLSDSSTGLISGRRFTQGFNKRLTSSAITTALTYTPIKDVQVDSTSVVDANSEVNLVTSSSHPYDASTNPLATIGDIGAAGGGTVTSVGVTNATDGGLTVSGSPITSSGSITVGHTNVLSSAQTTLDIYPIKIDKNGHISEYGSAVTIPTVNDGTLYITKNGGRPLALFTANQGNDNTLNWSTTSIGSASDWDAGSATVLGTDIPADDITAWTTNTPTAVDVSKFSGGSFTQGTFTQGSFTQGVDSFTANTPTVVDVTKFNGGSFTRGSFSGGSFGQGQDSFTPASLTATLGSNSATVANPTTLTISFNGGAFTQGIDQFTAATHGNDSFTPASLASGFYTAGTAASFTQGTDVYVKPTHASDSFTAASLASGFVTAGTAASLSYTPKSIPNVTSVGTAPSLTISPTTVVNDIS